MRLGYLIKIAAVLIGVAALGSLLLVYRWQLDAHSALAIAAAVFCAIFGISLFIWWSWLFQVRAKSIVEKWAAEHGYVVLQFESPFHSGAFSSCSRSQVVYCVTIRDPANRERKAWVRCGSCLGLSSDEIEVKWQDEPTIA